MEIHEKCKKLEWGDSPTKMCLWIQPHWQIILEICKNSKVKFKRNQTSGKTRVLLRKPQQVDFFPFFPFECDENPNYLLYATGPFFSHYMHNRIITHNRHVNRLNNTH